MFVVRRRLVPMSEALSRRNREAKRWMRVLGIDPAVRGPTGYGIVESDGQHCRPLHYGALKVSRRRQKECSGIALQEVHALLCRLIKDFAPDVVAVESIFSALNVRTALRLAEVRGVVLLAAAQHGLEVHSYAPREVKAAIAGHGHADKRQMQMMVRSLLSMKITPEPADAADALAVALCHVQAEQARRRLEPTQPKSFAKPLPLAADAGADGVRRALRAGGTTHVGLPRIQSTR